MRIEYSIEINCTPEQLWPFLEEPEKQKLWMKGVIDNTPTSEGPTRIGSTSKMKIKEGGKIAEYDIEVLAFEPNQKLGIKFWGGSFRQGDEMFVDYTLTPLDDRTRLNYLATMEVKGFFMNLMSPLFALFGKMQVKSFFRTLKELAEAPQTEAQAS